MSIPIVIDRMSRTPLHRQLYESLRDAIRDGRLAPGIRLASSRQLAAELGIARTTVIAAYDQLMADGYLEAREGAWTSVARVLPRGLVNVYQEPRIYQGTATPAITSDAIRLATETMGYTDPFEAPPRYDFAGVMTPALDAFPFDEWRRLVAEQWREVTPDSLIHFDSAGDRNLRQEITRFVRMTRGIECHVDQTIITSGSEHSLGLLCRILLTPGSRVAIEDPAPVGMRNVFQTFGAAVHPLPVDADGALVSQLRPLSAAHSPRLVHVTPTRQYPTGAVLSRQRRTELLTWASSHGALIIENDYDSELSYQGGALEALQAMDTHGVVAYLGSFAKILNPWIQLGYLIVPPQLVKPAVVADRVLTRQTDLVHQAVLAKFMNRGGLARHLYRLRRVHLLRRDALIEALHAAFGDEVVIGPVNSGLQAHVRWRSHVITPQILARARAAGVGLLPVRPMHIRPPDHDPGVLMAFANLTESDIRTGVGLLHEILNGAG